MSTLTKLWIRYGKPLLAVWTAIAIVSGGLYYQGYQEHQRGERDRIAAAERRAYEDKEIACNKELRQAILARTGATTELYHQFQQMVEANNRWTYELSHPPVGLEGDFGPARTAWLHGIGERATQRTDLLLQQMTETLKSRAANPLPDISCGK